MEMGPWYVLSGAFVSEPPGEKRGLRAKNYERMITKYPEKIKKFKIIKEVGMPKVRTHGVLEERENLKTEGRGQVVSRMSMA